MMFNIAKSMMAGAVGGLVGSYVMNQFQALVSAVATPNSTGKKESKQSDDATVRAAGAISRAVFDRDLTSEEKIWAGPAVHYGLGTVLGAVYGALALDVPALTAGSGMVFGSAVWLGADEVGVPAAGLSGPPTETPLSGHVNALASHLVYGVVTAVVRGILVRD